MLTSKEGFCRTVFSSLVKTRPHYALEIQKRISLVAEGYFKLEKNIVYDNLRKFEKKGILGSYREKSHMGAMRKYYYLTKFGERLFDEVVMSRLYPLVFSDLIIMKNIIEEYGMKNTTLPKELDRLQNLINRLSNVQGSKARRIR